MPQLFFLFNFKYLRIMKKEELFDDEFLKQFNVSYKLSIIYFICTFITLKNSK